MSGSLQQNVIDATANAWRKRLTACVSADSELLMIRKRSWTNKMQITLFGLKTCSFTTEFVIFRVLKIPKVGTIKPILGGWVVYFYKIQRIYSYI